MTKILISLLIGFSIYHSFQLADMHKEILCLRQDRVWVAYNFCEERPDNVVKDYLKDLR